MRGFEDSTNPLYLNLSPTVTTILNLVANGPIAIDVTTAEANTYGILCNVSGTRYFFPWSMVYMIRQVQPAPPVGAPPIITIPNK